MLPVLLRSPIFFLLQERMKVRHKEGFRPPQRGKRTDVAGDEVKLRWVWGVGRRLLCWGPAPLFPAACILACLCLLLPPHPTQL
jgi:hypothetical protein